MTEQEVMKSQGNGDLEEQTLDCPTDDDEQDSWEALVEFWAGTSQNVDQEAEIVTATDLTQSDTARITTATSESEPVRTPSRSDGEGHNGSIRDGGRAALTISGRKGGK